MWPCGLMDKALVFGTKDCRLQSCQGQLVSVAVWLKQVGAQATWSFCQSRLASGCCVAQAIGAQATWSSSDLVLVPLEAC